MRPIVLQEIRQYPVQARPTAALAWAHQYAGFGRYGSSRARSGSLLDDEPRRVKHPPVRFDKGMAVDQLA